MTPLFAAAFGITAIVALVFAFLLWRDDERSAAVAVSLPALAFLAAAVDYLWRALA